MKQKLLELMKTSEESGMPVWDWSPDEVAWEIQAYVDEFADADEKEMILYIKEIQEEYKK